MREKMAVEFSNYPPCGPLGSIEKRNPIPTKQFYEQLHQEGSNLVELWTEAQIAAWAKKIGEETKPCEFSAEKLADIKTRESQGNFAKGVRIQGLSIYKCYPRYTTP